MPAPYIALLRGINVSGRNIIPMAELRALCAGLGWDDVQSYIQSGNLVFRADGTSVRAGELESQLEGAIQARFGLTIPALVRTAAEWSAYRAGNPFPEATVSAPQFVHLALSKAPPEKSAAEKLQERGQAGERVILVGDALYIHYAGGAGASKITPVLLDRFAGSPVTARNWNTVLKIDEMVKQVSSGKK